MSPNPYRQNPELCVIGRQTSAERQRQAALKGVRAARPDDHAERQAIFAAHKAHADRFGRDETFTLIAGELGAYAPEIATPKKQARKAADRLFGGAK